MTALLIALFLLDAVTFAHQRIGIGRGALFSLIWLSLVGGFVNIPLDLLIKNGIWWQAAIAVVRRAAGRRETSQ